MTEALELDGPVAIMEDPRGGAWWEVEDVVAAREHKGSGRRRFLVRFKGFGPEFDEWKSEADVSEKLVQAYDDLCQRARGGDAGGAEMPPRRPPRRSGRARGGRGAEMPHDSQDVTATPARPSSNRRSSSRLRSLQR